MKVVLTRVKSMLYYYENGERREGIPSGIRGDVSGLSGDVSGIRGDVDNAELTQTEREQGINVEDLIKGD